MLQSFLILQKFSDDFATASVAAGTGGLDASVGFETTRHENAGPAINDSLFFFSFFVNAKTSSTYVFGPSQRLVLTMQQWRT